MKSELTTLMDLDVYTNQGRYVGKTEDVILDVDETKTSKLAINDLNSAIREEFNNPSGVLVPYRWVLAVGDIVIVKKLPKNVEFKEGEEKEVEEQEQEEVSEEESRPEKRRKKEGLFEY